MARQNLQSASLSIFSSRAWFSPHVFGFTLHPFGHELDGLVRAGFLLPRVLAPCPLRVFLRP